MKKIKFLLACIILLSFQNCKKDINDPTENNGEIVSEAKIGSEGGVLTTSDVEFSIPAGSLESTTQLKIIESDSIYDGENQFSQTFLLEGVPSTYTGELNVKIKYSKPLEDKSYIACHFKTAPISIGHETISCKYLEAKDSSGYLVGTIDFGDGNRTLKSTSEIAVTDIQLEFSATSRMSSTTETTENPMISFDIICPNDIPNEFRLKVVKYFAAISKIFAEHGFNYTARDNSELFPIYIVRDAAAADYGFSSRAFPWTINGSYIQLNYPICSTNDSELKSTIAHEFFHFVHSCYGFDSDNTLWLQEALCTFSEELLQDNPADFNSDQFLKFFNTPFNGMEAGKNWVDPLTQKASIQQHGYGMGAMIKEFYYNSERTATEKTKKTVLLELVQKGANEEMLPIDVLSTTFPDFKFLWQNYFDKFIVGDINFINQSTVRDQTVLDPNRIWTIFSDTDTQKVFNEQMFDLSTNIYRIHLNKDFDSTDVLNITANSSINADDIEVVVYKYSTNSGTPFPDYINCSSSTSDHEVVVERLDEIFKSYTSLLVVVKNSRTQTPYTGTSGIKVSFNVVKEKIKYIENYTWPKSQFLMYNKYFSADVTMSLSGSKFRIVSELMNPSLGRILMIAVPKLINNKELKYNLNVSFENLQFNPPLEKAPTLDKGEIYVSSFMGSSFNDNSGNWSIPLIIKDNEILPKEGSGSVGIEVYFKDKDGYEKSAGILTMRITQD